MDQCTYMPLHSGTQHTFYELVPFSSTFEDFPIVDFLITSDVHNIFCFMESLLLCLTHLEECLLCWNSLMQNFIWNCLTIYGIFLPYWVLPAWLDFFQVPAAVAVSYLAWGLIALFGPPSLLCPVTVHMPSLSFFSLRQKIFISIRKYLFTSSVVLNSLYATWERNKQMHSIYPFINSPKNLHK